MTLSKKKEKKRNQFKGQTRMYRMKREKTIKFHSPLKSIHSVSGWIYREFLTKKKKKINELMWGEKSKELRKES